MSKKEKEENVKAIGLFFSGYNDRKECKLTYETDSIIIKDEEIEAQKDTFLNVTYYFIKSSLNEEIGENGRCFGKFSPNYQRFYYDYREKSLTIIGGPYDKKQAYTAILK